MQDIWGKETPMDEPTLLPKIDVTEYDEKNEQLSQEQERVTTTERLQPQASLPESVTIKSTPDKLDPDYYLGENGEIAPFFICDV